jgi:hypothetical protein
METEILLNHHLSAFSPIGLKEMESVRLLNRVDTKFVLPSEKLSPVLDELRSAYRTLEIGGQRYQTYQTLYLDTPEAAMYLMHHNGLARRIKVRKRWYVGSNLAFFEVKRRTNKRRTIKTRLRLPGEDQEAREEFSAWVRDNCPYQMDRLVPRTWTKFHRITLVNQEMTERVTVDCNLSWKSALGDEDTMNLSPDEDWKTATREFCIVEVKQNGPYLKPLAMDVLRRYRVHPRGFSKYCVGTALLSPQLKRGCFRPLLRTLGDLH